MDNKNIDYLVLLILNFLSFVLGRVFAFWFGCKYCDCCKPFRPYIQGDWTSLIFLQRNFDSWSREKNSHSLYKYLHWAVARWKFTGFQKQVSSYVHPSNWWWESAGWGIPLHSSAQLLYDFWWYYSIFFLYMGGLF